MYFILYLAQNPDGQSQKQCSEIREAAAISQPGWSACEFFSVERCCGLIDIHWVCTSSF